MHSVHCFFIPVIVAHLVSDPCKFVVTIGREKKVKVGSNEFIFLVFCRMLYVMSP